MAKHPEVYNRREWHKVRAAVFTRANGLCERCKKKGLVKAGKIVHHKEHLTNTNKKDWNVSYNIKNLELLCNDCHELEHDRTGGLAKFVNPPGVKD